MSSKRPELQSDHHGTAHVAQAPRFVMQFPQGTVARSWLHTQAVAHAVVVAGYFGRAMRHCLPPSFRLLGRCIDTASHARGKVRRSAWNVLRALATIKPASQRRRFDPVGILPKLQVRIQLACLTELRL